MEPDRLIPQGISRYDVVSSTNEKAKETLDEGMQEGAVILAARQASGRGRYGRAWASPPGGLYLSIILKPEERGVQLLSLLSGLPVVHTLRRFGVESSLKWPNDVLVDDRKICGILCEGVYRRSVFWAVVGIGINVAVDLRRLPPDVQSSATSIRRENGRDADVESVLADLLKEYDDFYGAYARKETGRLLSEYRGTCTTLGESVVIETAKGRVSGRAIDVSSDGALVLDSGGRRVEVFEGTVVKPS